MITHSVTVLHSLEKWAFNGFWITSVWWKWCFTAELEGKGGASRQIQSNAANVTGDSVGLRFLSWGPNCVLQVLKDSRACSHHILNRISRVISKTHLLHSELSSFLSHNRKEILVAFLWSYLFFCACLFASPGIHAGQVPGCSCLPGSMCVIRAMDAALFCAV